MTATLHEISPVRSDDTLPQVVDVAVIGGGIVGATVALYLARAGVNVAIFEKGLFGAEQSSRNWGWVRQMGRDPRELPLAMASMREWAGLNATTGEETGFRVKGITYFAADDAVMAKYLGWLDAARPFGVDTRPITPDELAVIAPGLSRRYAGGLHTPSDGMAEPALATAAVVTGAQKLGVRAYAGCAVRGVETSAGRISAVVTEKGAVACSDVVLAGGGWSSLFAGSLGLRLPQLKFQANVMRSTPIGGGPEGCGSGPGFGYRKRLDGGYNVSMRSNHPVDIVPDSFRYLRQFWPAFRSEKKAMKLRFGKRSWEELMTPRRWRLDRPSPFEKHRIANPEPSHDILDKARENIVALFPVLSGIHFVEKIGGFVDSTPDALPVISGVDSLPGLWISTGYSGHGFGVAPAAGRMLAEMIRGVTPFVDPKPFRYGRLVDGSPIAHWPIGF